MSLARCVGIPEHATQAPSPSPPRFRLALALPEQPHLAKPPRFASDFRERGVSASVSSPFLSSAPPPQTRGTETPGHRDMAGMCWVGIASRSESGFVSSRPHVTPNQRTDDCRWCRLQPTTQMETAADRSRCLLAGTCYPPDQPSRYNRHDERYGLFRARRTIWSDNPM